MQKYNIALLLGAAVSAALGCSPTVEGLPGSVPRGPGVEVQTKTIPVVVTNIYDAMPTMLLADKRLSYNGPKGTWSSVAGFDFIRGRPVLYDIVYTVRARDPKAIENRLYEIDLGGAAWLNLDAKTPCNGGVGDLVSDGNGNTACVTPWLSMDITDAAGTLLFDRSGPDPVPPVAWAEPLPRGTYIPMAAGMATLQLRLHVRGTMTFTIDPVAAWIAEKTWDFVCDGSVC